MSRSAPRGVLTVGAVGFLLVVVGVVVLLATDAEPEYVYEGSYVPLTAPEDGVASWAVAVTAGQLTGAALSVVGALLLAGVIGWLLCAGSPRGRRGEP